MGLSRRQKIIELLKKYGPYRADLLAKEVGVRIDDIGKEVERVDRALRKQGMYIRVIPGYCKKCGYKFPRSFDVPSKCPKCHSQWIEPPMYEIREK